MQRTNPAKKLNFKLYDIDGCLYHKFSGGGSSPATIKTWLIQSNKVFFDQQIEEIKTNGYDTVIVGYGTNRQDKGTDFVNSYRGGSCAPALPIVQSHLQNNLDCPVLLSTFWMADIYGKNIQAGTSYKLALKDYLKIPYSEKHPEWVFDGSKISLIYAHIHRIATLHPDSTTIDVDFYDDRQNILGAIAFFYKEHPELLPSNVKLKLYLYAGMGIDLYSNPINGTGITDKHYEWSTRFISSMTYFFHSSAGEDQKIKTAEALRQYHEDDHYHRSGHIMELGIHADFDVDRLITMRDNEIPKLADRSTLGSESGFTTAENLYQEIQANVATANENEAEKKPNPYTMFGGANAPVDNKDVNNVRTNTIT